MTEFIRACGDLAEAIYDAIADIVGTPEAGERIKIGADGTPTKRIDQIAEDIVVDYFTDSRFCRHLVSEELGCTDMGGERGTIFLDPIDGTYNATVGIPFYAFSIAYAEEGVVQQGYVTNLATKEAFHAIRGQGAYLDGHPIQTSDTSALGKSAMSIHGPRRSDPTPLLQFGGKIRRLRLLGASALELCYVGCGRIDAFIDMRETLRTTDIAAGMLICEEAGGAVSDIRGEKIAMSDEISIKKSLIATNGVIHDKIIGYLG